MIFHKAHLIKLKTDDGEWDYNRSFVDPNALIGKEVWVRANTFRMSAYIHKGEPLNRKTILMCELEGGSSVPVELLEFTSEFRVS